MSEYKLVIPESIVLEVVRVVQMGLRYRCPSREARRLLEEFCSKAEEDIMRSIKEYTAALRATKSPQETKDEQSLTVVPEIDATKNLHRIKLFLSQANMHIEIDDLRLKGVVDVTVNKQPNAFPTIMIELAISDISMLEKKDLFPED